MIANGQKAELDFHKRFKQAQDFLESQSLDHSLENLAEKMLSNNQNERELQIKVMALATK